MLTYVISCLLVVTCVVTGAVGQASSNNPSDPTNAFQCSLSSLSDRSPVCLVTRCTSAITRQVERELNAAFSYMFLAAHFEDDRQARPGLAKFLFESASEEREHAISMLAYLDKRGVEFTRDYSFNGFDEVLYQNPPTYQWALETALKMEVLVTDAIYSVIHECQSDFHGADFFTDPILAEQHEGIRKLQGAIQSFLDLQGGHPDSYQGMAEYLYDQKMLSEGL